MKPPDQLYLIRVSLAFLIEAGVPITKSMSVTILNAAMSHLRAASGRRGPNMTERQTLREIAEKMRANGAL